MKRIFNIYILIIVSTYTTNATDINKEKVSLNIDTKSSNVYWTGKKISGQHTGYLKISSGTVLIKGKEIIDAELNIDMKSIECTDLKGNAKDKLIAHLKSDDFFSVEKYPISSLKMTSFKENIVEASLTIKGITNKIQFPIKIDFNQNTITASGTVLIDRTKWDIKYGSGKFFKGIGDKMIKDEFEIRFELVTKSESIVEL